MSVVVEGLPAPFNLAPQAPEVEADLAAICHGWNDRWRAWGTIDQNRKTTVGSSNGPLARQELARRSRMLQAILDVLASLVGENRSHDRIVRQGFGTRDGQLLDLEMSFDPLQSHAGLFHRDGILLVPEVHDPSPGS